MGVSTTTSAGYGIELEILENVDFWEVDEQIYDIAIEVSDELVIILAGNLMSDIGSFVVFDKNTFHSIDGYGYGDSEAGVTPIVLTDIPKDDLFEKFLKAAEKLVKPKNEKPQFLLCHTIS